MPAKPARTLIVPLVVLAVAAGTVDARADDYPSRPVHIVVPYAAGGGTDAMARFIARGLEKKLGQPVIIDNVTGAVGSIGVVAAFAIGHVTSESVHEVRVAVLAFAWSFAIFAWW